MPEGQFRADVDSILDQVDEASKHLEPVVRLALRNEIAAHLDESIRARIEYGDTPEEAIRGAIAAFGVAEAAVPPKPKDKRFDRLFLGGLAGFCSLYAGAFLGPSDPAATIILVGMLLCLIAGIVGTWMSRRIHWRGFAMVAIPLWVAIAAALSVVYITPVPGQYRLNRSTLPESIAQMEKSMFVQAATIRNIEGAYAVFKREGGLQIARDFDPDTGAIKFRRARDEAHAERAWDLLYSELPEMRKGMAETEAWIESARSPRPWYAEIPYQLGEAAIGAAAVMALFALPHLVTLFLAWFVDEIRRLTRRGGSRKGTA